MFVFLGRSLATVRWHKTTKPAQSQRNPKEKQSSPFLPSKHCNAQRVTISNDYKVHLEWQIVYETYMLDIDNSRHRPNHSNVKDEDEKSNVQQDKVVDLKDAGDQRARILLLLVVDDLAPQRRDDHPRPHSTRPGFSEGVFVHSFLLSEKLHSN